MTNRLCNRVAWLVGIGLYQTIPVPAFADVFHYSNILIGERAVGLGGAFAGVADDASGLFYNPAGLAFASSNDISGSANAYMQKSINYKKIIGNEDFTERSQAFLPTFFGSVQKLDWLSQGLTAGFAVYSTDNELKDQDDLMTDATDVIKAYHRTLTTRNSTLYVSFGAAKLIGSRFSIGATVSFVNIDETSQQYQDSVIKSALRPRDPANGDIYLTYTENFYTHLVSRGFEPMLGLQYAPFDTLSIGLSIKKPFLIQDSLNVKVDAATYFRFLSNNKIVSVDDVVEADQKQLENMSGVVMRTTSTENTNGGPKNNANIENPLGSLPPQIRLGFGWFPTNRFLLTFDTNLVLADDSGVSSFQREQVINFHLGTEYYFTPSFLTRAGLFTNFDSRSNDVGTSSSGEYINFYGASLYLGLAQETNQLGLGSVYQMAKGRAIKVAGGNPTDVDGHILSVLFSASHNF